MMNPLSTGSEMKEARNPSLSSPAAMARSPVASARPVVSATKSAGSELTVATTPIDKAAVADMGETTRWRDDPITA